MAHRIELAPTKRHIRVTIDGEMNRAVAAEVGLEAAAVGREAGVDRFLYDLRAAPNTETVLSNYQFANEELPELDLERAAPYRSRGQQRMTLPGITRGQKSSRFDWEEPAAPAPRSRGR